MKKIMSVLLVVLLIASCAIAEETTQACPSVTVAAIVTPESNVAAEGLVISLSNLQPETKEQKVLEEIAVFVEEKPVIEYFGEETMAAVVEFLPETVETANLVLDEIFVLNVEGYDNSYGDVEAVFEFATTYEDDTVLVVMVGVLPADESEDDEIIWIPLKASVHDGKVNIAFTQDVLEVVQANSSRVVLSLLRAEETI